MITATTKSCGAPTEVSISHSDELNMHPQLCRLQLSLHLDNFASKFLSWVGWCSVLFIKLSSMFLLPSKHAEKEHPGDAHMISVKKPGQSKIWKD